MFEVNGAVSMLNEFVKVCDGMSQAITWSESLGERSSGLRANANAWTGLRKDVDKFFSETPNVSEYKTRWDHIVNQVARDGKVTDTAIINMYAVFQDMIARLSDTEITKDMPGDKQQAVKIFISHNSADKEYCQPLFNFLMFLGFKQGDVICTSIPNCGPPVGKDIYEWLREHFDKNIHVIYMLSDNFFQSVPSVSEMGAAWVTQKSYTSFILPGFSMSKAKGPIDKDKMGVNLNLDDYEIRAQLKQFAKLLGAGVDLNQIEYAAEQFIKSLKTKDDGLIWHGI